ncbi:zinc-dependent alcohol dehydrogenase family protein [Tuberibacillus sp. Marseille-P3662]|uniref:zinc-dependent alcohol dehydrogenase family protein n=1 Tax=Tuberibacillus sp. Marseille-P3662 TaxID=1965358 RepID=UPI000A1C9595|nr:zinc-dependent alcohol dehydrogenase family protein [Tuberibacillus sp. Marseille-P3662]
MKAHVLNTYGESATFETVEMARPETTSGHVLIRVAASSVNPLDVGIRKGAPSIFAPELPAVIHGDVAGVIENVGEGVTQFQPGDEIYACAGGVRGTAGGALADYMLADADLVAHKPHSLSMKEAASLPLVTLTAWEGLIDRANIQAGQKVLIHGGTGGVGHVAIQIAKWAGATVYATASSEDKLAIAKDLGSDHVINYRAESVQDYVEKYTDGKGFDVVFDTVGGKNLDQSIEAAALYGDVINILSGSEHDLSLLSPKGITLHGVLMLIPLLHNMKRDHHGKVLSKAAELVEQGQLRPLVDKRSFNFGEVADAHQYLESGEAIGKVTLTNPNFSK